MSKRLLNKIKREASKLTIDLGGNDYTLEELEALSRTQLLNSNLSDLTEPISSIINNKNLAENEFSEIREYVKKQGANKWKARIRKQKREGKLEQYQLDTLNKLGMIWHPKGGGGSFDEWENNYLIFKNFGFCIEVKDWVTDQRNSYKINSISKENLLRLHAIDFPFEEKANEEYVLTRKYVWNLRQELEIKINNYINEEKEKYDLNDQTDKIALEEKIKKDFYSNAWGSWDLYSTLSKLNEKEGFECLEEILKGNSINVKFSNIHAKKSLEIVSKQHKEKNKKIPDYIKQYYAPKKKERLNDNEIYNELSFFNGSKINPKVRKQACKYMLKYCSIMDIRSTKFLEIKYLISEFKKEKNLSELIELSLFIREYPILKELYLEKLESTIFKLSAKK